MFQFNRFYSPDDSESRAPGKEELSKEDVITLLGEEDKEETLDLTESKEKKVDSSNEEETDETKEESPEDEDDELKALEEELEGPDEEQLELMTPARRKDILKEFPTLFKKFPYLERAYYRDQQFTELLPTIDDAKEAVSKAQALDNFEKDLVSGSTETILKAIKETDGNAFNKIVDDYLPTLAKVDEKAYYHVLGTVIKNTIISMANEAKRSSNDALNNAALLLNQFAFGTSDFEPPSKLSKDVKPEEDVVKKREQEFTQRQFDTVRNDLGTKVDNVLKATIEGNIDPKGSMTDYVKRNAVRDALENVKSLIGKDARFKSISDSLWEQVFKTNFNKTSIDKVRSAYLSKAKTLLLPVIKQARSEALKGSSGKSKNEDNEDTKEETTVHKDTKPRNSTSSSVSGNSRNAKSEARKIPQNMRSVDFLMQD